MYRANKAVWLAGTLITAGVLHGCFDSSDKSRDRGATPDGDFPTALEVSNENCTISGTTLGACLQVNIDDTDRVFAVYKPSTFSRTAGMLMVLHGLNDDVVWQNEYFQAERIAEETGKLVVLPRGTVLTGPARTGAQVWNATSACCFFDSLFKPAPDDVKFLTAVIDEVNTAYGLNEKATVLMGYSNGAFMANRMACEVSEKIGAIITQSGLMRLEVNECKPENQVSSFHIHGTLDQSIPWQGNTINRDVGDPTTTAYYTSFPLPIYARTFFSGAEEVTQRWSQINGCNEEPTNVERIEGFTSHDGVFYTNDYTTIPDSGRVAVLGAELSKYSECVTGVGVQALKVINGTHKPVYDYDKYVPIVTDFINTYGTREATPVKDIADSPHYAINDNGDGTFGSTASNGSALVPVASVGLVGTALVRDNANSSYFVRVGFDDATAANRISAIKLLDENSIVVGEASTDDALITTRRFAYATIEGVSIKPSILALTVDGQETTSPITFANIPPEFSATISDDSGEVGTLTLKALGPVTMNYSFTVPAGRDASAIKFIRFGSTAKAFDLFPIPTGLPDPDDYIGENSFYSLVSTGGFQFVANEEDGTSKVDGFAEDKTDGPAFYYEELIGAPERYTAEVELNDGTLARAVLQRAN